MLDTKDAARDGTYCADRPAPSRSEMPWQDHEICYLIERALEGLPFEAIGSAIRRSGAACVRMLHRLIDGEAHCPDAYQFMLAEARRRFGRKTVVTGPTLREMIAQVETIQCLTLALEVLAGNVTLKEITLVAGEAAALRVRSIAASLADIRQGDSTDASQTAPIAFAEGGQTIGGEMASEVGGDDPLVLTGQGTYQQTLSPADVSRGSGALDVMA